MFYVAKSQIRFEQNMTIKKLKLLFKLISFP